MRPREPGRWLGRVLLVVALAVISLGAGPSARAEPSRDPPLGVAADDGGTGSRGGGEPTARAAGAERSAAAGGEVGAAGGPAAGEAEPPPPADLEEVEEYDPWEPFNERTFAFNRQLDRWVLKPVATGWNRVVPEPMRQGLKNAAQNLGMPRRVVHSLLQLKLEGALRELTRFVLNSTLGVGGLFDVARGAGIAASDEDAGQTLGVYGVGPGPYLVLPFFPPLTVRDGVGLALDAALDPLNYLLAFAGRAGIQAGTTVNDRSLNLELFQDVEESVLDLYSAVRNAYLQRRARAVRE